MMMTAASASLSNICDDLRLTRINTASLRAKALRSTIDD